MNQNEAFEIAQKEISINEPDYGEFHLVSAELLANGDWVLEVGCVSYLNEDYVFSEYGQWECLDDSDVGEPCQYIIIQCSVTQKGEFEDFIESNYDLEEHPNYKQAVQ